VAANAGLRPDHETAAHRRGRRDDAEAQILTELDVRLVQGHRFGRLASLAPWSPRGDGQQSPTRHRILEGHDDEVTTPASTAFVSSDVSADLRIPTPPELRLLIVKVFKQIQDAQVKAAKEPPKRRSRGS
jgi:hypothetical protein